MEVGEQCHSADFLRIGGSFQAWEARGCMVEFHLVSGID